MKREIKFRAWINDLSHLFYSDELDRMDQFFESIIPLRTTDDLMQFTGLHDKNGKEIYEGDIIRNFTLKGEVVYHQERAMFILHDENNFNEPLYQDVLAVEVIGNIYENPELLK